MPREAKRRFLGLDVDEVSAVDSPANERELLVIKNLEEDEMPEGTTETREDTNNAAAVERVAVEAPKGDAAVVSKALGEVTKMVDSIVSLAKGNAAPAAAPAAPTAAPDATTEGDEDVEKKKNKFPKAMFRQMMEKMGVSKDAIGSLLAGIEKEFDAAANGAPTKKNADEEEPAVEAATPITLEMLQKASALSPEYVAGLQQAFETLKLVIEAIAPNASPKTKVPGSTMFGASGVRELANPAPAPVVKGVDPAIAEALQGFTGVLKSMNDRMEAIEKARPASVADGDDDATETETQKKNFWGGIL